MVFSVRDNLLLPTDDISKEKRKEWRGGDYSLFLVDHCSGGDMGNG